MKNKINDGGPAFPIGHPDCSTAGQSIKEAQGMTLRDHFAGLALQGILISSTTKTTASKMTIVEMLDRDVAAMAAYQFADAMIAERSKQ